MDMDMDMSCSHMTFFWSSDTEILFDGWPGTRGGMYALALIFVFALAILLEYFSHSRYLSKAYSNRSRVAGGLLQTAVLSLRVGLAYLLMLAVMSFNGGVLLVAVLGHAVGFLLFGSRVFQKEVASVIGGR